ncbi:type II secretion system protein [bacterium]|nr:type II secretion system protein [bacterium]
MLEIQGGVFTRKGKLNSFFGFYLHNDELRHCEEDVSPTKQSRNICHPELVSESISKKMLKQVQHDIIIRKELIHLITYSPIDFKKAAFTPHRNARRAEGTLPSKNNPVNCFCEREVSDACLMRVGQESGYSAANFGKTPRLLRSAGVTLAEVLITIGIIGVVAAMTIPTLIQKNQKRIIEANMKENYSIIQQVIRQNEANDIDIVSEFKDGDIQFLKTWFETYFEPYMKYNRVCYDTEGCWQNKGPTKILTGGTVYANRDNIGIGSQIITVKLNNGSNLVFNICGSSSMRNYCGMSTTGSGLSLYIDANGDSPPNVIGKDIYVLCYSSAHGLIPAGYNIADSEVNKNCSKNASGDNAGFYCLMRIKNHGWQILDEVWRIKT